VKHFERNVHFFAQLIVLLLSVAWPLALFAADEQFARERLLTVWAGALPIVISAPHGGREPLAGVPPRTGVGVSQFVTGRDTRTDELAENIAVKLARTLGAKPFLIVAHIERKFLDPNRPRNAAYESEHVKAHYDAYHHALAQACRRVRAEWGRGLLLDIHGEGSDAEAIFRGTGNGQTVESLTDRFGVEALNGAKSIIGQLAQRGYKVFPTATKSEKELRYAGGFIVQSYGSHKRDGIDAMQLEFGTSLRERSLLDRTATDVADAVAVFARAYLPALK
jgi:N-formylglutamate amidohydrolase